MAEAGKMKTSLMPLAADIRNDFLTFSRHDAFRSMRSWESARPLEGKGLARIPRIAWTDKPASVLASIGYEIVNMVPIADVIGTCSCRKEG